VKGVLILKRLCVVFGLLCCYNNSVAEIFPKRPVRLVVPLAIGGGGDITARILAQGLSNHWATNVIVDNKPGAGGSIGNSIVANSTPNGYTILFTTSTLAIGPAVYKNTLDIVNSLQPLTLVASQPSVILVNNNLNIKTVDQLIAIAKQKQLKFGSAGIGTASHLANELLAQKTNINLLHIQYKSAGQSTQALLSNEVDFSVTNMATTLTQLKSKRLTALAVTSNKRTDELPLIPTMKELGHNYEYTTWYGMALPKSVNTALQNKIYNDIMFVLNTDTIKQTLNSQGLDIIGLNPQQFTTFLKNEIQQWQIVVKQANIKIQ
jgi:tripartite-type tricarboxylate transporter receptor subunit TctC